MCGRCSHAGLAGKTPAPSNCKPGPTNCWCARAPATGTRPSWNWGPRCAPQKPRCAQCPVAAVCLGKASPERYPAPRCASKKQSAVALVLQGPDKVHLEPRRGKVLGGLWGVPMAEGEGAHPKNNSYSPALVWLRPALLERCSTSLATASSALRSIRLGGQPTNNPKRGPSRGWTKILELCQRALALERQRQPHPLLGHLGIGSQRTHSPTRTGLAPAQA